MKISIYEVSHKIPDNFYRVCLTGIFTRATIKRQLTDKQGKRSL
ncbi:MULTISPECIES: hypothetical protein [unclassified Nostoc]|nr:MULTISPECIES: hypothetical protein [unclassified Nostoc]